MRSGIELHFSACGAYAARFFVFAESNKEDKIMSKLRKMTAVLLSVIMVVCMFCIPAGAATVYDKAVKLSPMELASGKFDKKTEYFYKISFSDSGKITFYCTDYANTRLTLLDSNGNEVISKEYISYCLNKQYDITKKGNYYLKLEQSQSYNSRYFNNFYYGFNPNDDVTITLSVTMKVGQKLDLSAVTSNYKGNITWKSTNTSVATVSKGKITAKKKGTTKIRAYMNNGDYAEIIVKVTK